jgi:hypothetical protein
MSEVVRLMPAHKRIQHLEALLHEQQCYVMVLTRSVESLAQILDVVAETPMVPPHHKAHLLRILAQTRGMIAKFKPSEDT